MGVTRPRWCPADPAAVAALVCFLSIQHAFGDVDLNEPAGFGDDDFYVKFQAIESNHGVLDPKFSRGHSEYTLKIEDYNAKMVQLNLILDLKKYNLIYPPGGAFPKLEWNGTEYKYIPVKDIPINISLDSLHGAYDATQEFTLSDPHPKESAVSGFFGGITGGKAEGAHFTYKIRVRQRPEMSNIVDAESIMVREAGTKKIVNGTPPFDPDAPHAQVHFSYVVPADADEIEVAAICHKDATSLLVNSEEVEMRQSDPVWTPVKIDVHSSSALVQCVYEEPYWLPDQVLQRTYILNVRRDLKLSEEHVRVEVQMQATDGFCTHNDEHDWMKGWTCRSIKDHPNMVAWYNSSKVEVQMAGGDESMEFTLFNALPTQTMNPRSKDGDFFVYVRAIGNANDKFPLQMFRPAPCTDIGCPVGQTRKSKMAQAAFDHICYEKVCNEKLDQPHCCEEGIPHNVVITDFGDHPDAGAKAISEVTGWSVEDSAIFIEHSDVPVVVVSSVAKSAADAYKHILVKAGISVDDVLCPDASYRVELKDTSVDADVKRIENELYTDGEMDEISAKSLTLVGEGVIKEFHGDTALDKAKVMAEHLQAHGITQDQLGASIQVSEVIPDWDVKMEGFDPDLSGDRLDTALEALMDESCMRMSRSQAEKTLKELPGYVAAGLSQERAELCKALMRQVQRPVGLEVTTTEPGEHIPWYLNSYCYDLKSAACISGMAPQNGSCGLKYPNSTYKCPKALTPVLNGTCRGKQCLTIDMDRCCGEPIHCRDAVCPLHYGKKLPDWDTFVAEQDVIEVCCQKSAFCDTYECPESFLLHTHASEISCETPTCEGDWATKICCNQVSMCSTFDCPPSMVHKPNASKLILDSLTSEACCDPRHSCDGFTCPTGLALKGIPPPATVLCKGANCTADDDAETCCEGAGTCYGFGLCPQHTVLKEDPGKLSCATQVCVITDAATCCEKVATCDSYTCPDQMTIKTTPAPAMIDCLGPKCTSKDMPICCEGQALCSTMACPFHYGIKADKADFSFCKGAVCTDDDKDTCCEAQESCANLKAPDGFQLRPTAADLWVNEWDEDSCWVKGASCDTFYGCPNGFTLRPSASDYTCGAEVCSDVDAGVCCKKGFASTSHSEDQRYLPFLVNVTDTATGRDCKVERKGARFWCQSDEPSVKLVVKYRPDGEDLKTKPLDEVSVPSIDDGPTHLTVILRDSHIETTRLSIWVYRYDWQTAGQPSEVELTQRRLQVAAGKRRPAPDRVYVIDVTGAGAPMRRAAAAAGSLPAPGRPPVWV